MLNSSNDLTYLSLKSDISGLIIFFIYNQFLFHNANIVKKIEKVKKKLKNFDKIPLFDSPPYPPHQYYCLVVVAHECRGLAYVVLVGKVYVKLVLVPFRRYLIGCDSSCLHAYHVSLSFYNLSQCLHNYCDYFSCLWRDSNPHGHSCPEDFKSPAYTSFATQALSPWPDSNRHG